MKKIYRFLFAGVLALCATGCSSSLLDIENPNEVTNTTSPNIKYIDNQLVTVIKIQMICKCKYKTI